MRVALIIASALALAVALVIIVGGDDEDATVVETTPVTAPTTIETVPAPGEPDVTTPSEMGEDATPDTSGNQSGGAEAPSRCGRFAFAASTDSGAAEIKAVGTDCETARAVARAAQNATDELAYEAEGFRCAGARSENAGLASIEWLCVGAEREVVSFVTT